MDEAAPASLTPLQQAAAQAHELFTSLTEAGFTEQQALAIVIGIMAQNRKRTD